MYLDFIENSHSSVRKINHTICFTINDIINYVEYYQYYF